MYCKNCGAELRPDANFCTQCGTPVEAEETAYTYTSAEEVQTPQTEDRSDGWGKLELFGMLAALLCTILLLCFEWIAVPVRSVFGTGRNNFSLFEVADLIRVFNQLGISQTIATVGCVMIFAVLVLSIILMAVGWVSAWRRNTKWCGAGLVGVILAFLATVGTMLVVLVLWFQLTYLSGGLVSISISVTAAPWLMLIVLIAYLILMLRLLAQQKFSGCLKGILYSGIAVLVILAVIGIATTTYSFLQSPRSPYAEPLSPFSSEWGIQEEQPGGWSN